VRYYIAINGSSCALSTVPWRKPPRVVPAPEVLIGFPTLAEATEAQHFLLNAPVPEMTARLVSYRDRRPDLTVIRLPNPGPQTAGETVWLDPDF
jgi:hypothetical protein